MEPQYHQSKTFVRLSTIRHSGNIISSKITEKGWKESIKPGDSNACHAFFKCRSSAWCQQAARATSAGCWGWFSIPSSWIWPCSSCHLGKGCDCFCNLCKVWQAGLMPGSGGALSSLGFKGQWFPYLHQNSCPSWSCQTKSLVWCEVSFQFNMVSRISIL